MTDPLVSVFHAVGARSMIDKCPANPSRLEVIDQTSASKARCCEDRPVRECGVSQNSNCNTHQGRTDELGAGCCRRSAKFAWNHE